MDFSWPHLASLGFPLERLGPPGGSPRDHFGVALTPFGCHWVSFGHLGVPRAAQKDSSGDFEPQRGLCCGPSGRQPSFFKLGCLIPQLSRDRLTQKGSAQEPKKDPREPYGDQQAPAARPPGPKKQPNVYMSLCY